MRKVYDLCVKISEYQDNYNKTRARWRNVGSVMEDEKGGRFILLDKFFNFAQVDTQGRDNILISLFEPKNVDNNSSAGSGFNNSGSGFNNSSSSSGFNNSSAGFNNPGAGFNNNNQPMPSKMQGNWQRSDFNSFDNLSSDSGVPF